MLQVAGGGETGRAVAIDAALCLVLVEQALDICVFNG